MPKSLKQWINSRFDKNDVELEESAAFDVVRAAVNLVLASMLITIGTNLKLPLSTTYVTLHGSHGFFACRQGLSRESAYIPRNRCAECHRWMVYHSRCGFRSLRPRLPRRCILAASSCRQPSLFSLSSCSYAATSGTTRSRRRRAREAPSQLMTQLARCRNRMGSASPSCVTHTELRMPLRPE